MSYTYDPPTGYPDWYDPSKPFVKCTCREEHTTYVDITETTVIWWPRNASDPFPWIDEKGERHKHVMPVEAWKPKPDEWVIIDTAIGPTLVIYGNISTNISGCARYEQADGTLTDLRGGWAEICKRTEVKNER